ncbi:hypothetical protein QBZ16_005364 [Prototheca wickerhamii]|uniref:Calcineurin-like phosphoesterase domain-containing protein n=1 Tax=Prototheca wickerhamii TaxID=3111 RepID=A0AAD9MGD7_PROWI|nr:hypothetical protein QBZ16_005364 [Prototheca wickerhamii]
MAADAAQVPCWSGGMKEVRAVFAVPASVLPAPARIVAIGDLHGDLGKAKRAFRVAGVVDARGDWCGGAAAAVQVGDVLDRGVEELQILFWLERLARQAAAAGGAVHVLNGNHETMNAAGDFRYALPGGYDEFARFARTHALELALKGRCGLFRGTAEEGAWRARAKEFWGLDGPAARAAALRPGSGPVTRRFLARHPLALQLGSTVFVHGGVLPAHAEMGLGALNRGAFDWLRGAADAAAPPRFLLGRKAVVWARDYSAEDPAACDCTALGAALRALPGARRMVVGHTIQEQGVNSACEGRVFRVDVGLSWGCADGAPAALEIRDDGVMRRLDERAPAGAGTPAQAPEPAPAKVPALA